MELIELQTMWSEYDRKIVKNTRLNKEILRRMLLEKPQKRLNRIRLKSLFTIISPFVLFLPVFFLTVEYHPSLHFLTGSILFGSLAIIAYIWEVKHYLLIRKIDFTGPVLSVKKDIAEMKRFRIRTTRIRYCLSPFAVLGIFLMIIQKPVLFINKESVIMIALMIIVFAGSVIYTFRYSIREQFSRLDKEISELEDLEKD